VLSGFCSAYFLALFSNSQSIEKSLCLFISTLLFSVCLPIFTAFAIAHVYMSESELTVEQCNRALNLKWINWFTISAFTLLYLAVWFLTAFFPLWVMGLFTIASATCFFIFGIFISAVGCNLIAPLILFLIACTTAALQTVQCTALIAPYVFRQSDGTVLLIAMPRHQGNKRGDLRPEFFIMPPFKTAGRRFGAP
jgi:hypothetical protein